MNKTNIKALLVDDDVSAQLLLNQIIDKLNTGISLCAVAATVAEAVEAIDTHEPDLVFLDISLPDGEGFDVLEQVTFHGFEVIFTTSHDEFALKAFEVSAIQYLIKPVKTRDLDKALQRFTAMRGSINVQNHEAQRYTQHRILVPDAEGIHILRCDQIVRCEASDTYTIFWMHNGRKLVASRPLGSFERLLNDQFFCRIHSKHLVNLAYIKLYLRGKGGSVVLEDGTELEVSVRKKNDLMLAIHNFARSL
ncbi:MAG: LytTR family DNA-binding domain-containing protein [Bacteroidales bacterium]|jgi:two-component system LytT family response regulator|nr:LytTR family DNA-binding domain-containing protein [Bacteroidales bacterium]MDD3665306.1 LytTR family DNA-binding domain-containing protein [Bacteroidales bacterium]